MGDYVNSMQVKFDKAAISCGVLEAHHLPNQSAAKTAFSIVNNLYHKANPRPAAFVIFSDVEDNGQSRGDKLAAFIRDQIKPKQFVSFGPCINPKTGNSIKLYVWTLDHEPLRKWYQDELANRVDTES